MLVLSANQPKKAEPKPPKPNISPKKMPGMEVSDKGEIKYNGKAINKFYIEGHDMLGGQFFTHRVGDDFSAEFVLPVTPPDAET